VIAAMHGDVEQDVAERRVERRPLAVPVLDDAAEIALGDLVEETLVSCARLGGGPGRLLERPVGPDRGARRVAAGGTEEPDALGGDQVPEQPEDLTPGLRVDVEILQ